MRVEIEADSQEEFDGKREALLKSLAGNQYDVIKKAKAFSLYDQEKPPIENRRAFFTVQNEMMDYWDSRYQKMINDLKKDVDMFLESIV